MSLTDILLFSGCSAGVLAGFYGEYVVNSAYRLQKLDETIDTLKSVRRNLPAYIKSCRSIDYTIIEESPGFYVIRNNKNEVPVLSVEAPNVKPLSDYIREVHKEVISNFKKSIKNLIKSK